MRGRQGRERKGRGGRREKEGAAIGRARGGACTDEGPRDEYKRHGEERREKSVDPNFPRDKRP